MTITKQSVFSSLKQDCMHCLTLSYAFIINSLSHAQITFIYYCMFIRLQMHVHVQNPVTFLILSNTSLMCMYTMHIFLVYVYTRNIHNWYIFYESYIKLTLLSMHKYKSKQHQNYSLLPNECLYLYFGLGWSMNLKIKIAMNLNLWLYLHFSKIYLYKKWIPII